MCVCVFASTHKTSKHSRSIQTVLRTTLDCAGFGHQSAGPAPFQGGPSALGAYPLLQLSYHLLARILPHSPCSPLPTWVNENAWDPLAPPPLYTFRPWDTPTPNPTAQVDWVAVEGVSNTEDWLRSHCGGGGPGTPGILGWGPWRRSRASVSPCAHGGAQGLGGGARAGRAGPGARAGGSCISAVPTTIAGSRVPETGGADSARCGRRAD